jgi:membrane fusion protein, multidrug efflux system
LSRRGVFIAIDPIPLLIVIALAGLLAPPVEAQAPGVIVAKATELPFPLTVEALGTLRANESVEIRPQINEAVEAIRFEEGQLVQAGAVLVELRDTQARAAVAGAEAALAESESRYVRSHKLFEDQLVSAADLEPLEARRNGDRAALDAARARLAETVVRAPFAGRLGLRRISKGSLVGPSTVITTLDDTHVMKLDFDVPETALALLRDGLPVLARSAAYPDSVFRGRVISVDTRVDEVSRTVTVRAQLPNPRRLLRPGMFMSVQLLRNDIRALVVPEEAIVPEQSRLFVFVVGGNGVVAKRAIRIGRRRPGLVEILGGLEKGEDVVVEGTQKVREGQTAQVLRRVEVKP